MSYTVPSFPSNGNPVEANDYRNLHISLRKYINNYISESDLIGRLQVDINEDRILDSRYVNRGSYLGVRPEHWFAFGKQYGNYDLGDRVNWCWTTGKSKSGGEAPADPETPTINDTAYLRTMGYQPIVKAGQDIYMERDGQVLVQFYIEYHAPYNNAGGAVAIEGGQFLDNRLDLFVNSVRIECTRGYHFEETDASIIGFTPPPGVEKAANQTTTEYQYFRAYQVSELIDLPAGNHRIQVMADTRNDMGYAACRSFSIEQFYTSAT